MQTAKLSPAARAAQAQRLQPAQLAAYARYLQAKERSAGTIQKYLRDTRAFARWAAGRPVDHALAAQWRDALLAKGYAPVTVNSMLAALNGLFGFLGWQGCRVRFLKVQRRLFRDVQRELTRAEYRRLLRAARTAGRPQLALLLETLCATGIRVSELRYITLQAAQTGRAEIRLKGKARTILLPARLCRKLLHHAQKNKIAFGELFLTKGGKGLPRRQVWAQMKALCRPAQVARSKVFPHNLRHLFATEFYSACRDLARLADVLGHSSMETTRLYLLTSGAEHARVLERLGLVS